MTLIFFLVQILHIFFLVQKFIWHTCFSFGKCRICTVYCCLVFFLIQKFSGTHALNFLFATEFAMFLCHTCFEFFWHLYFRFSFWYRNFSGIHALDFSLVQSFSYFSVTHDLDFLFGTDFSGTQDTDFLFEKKSSCFSTTHASVFLFGTKKSLAHMI